jgi:hypothetical protein
MSRAMRLITILCAASLLGNLWLYRELKKREGGAPVAVASPSQAPSPIAETNAVTAPTTNSIAGSPKPTAKQMMEKCKRKLEDELRSQFRDPTKRENMKRQEIMALQAMNVGAQTRLHLSDQTFGRILELQAERDLSEREASIDKPSSFSEISANPQIAEEFGDVIASKWTEYLREYRGRVAVRAVANLFTDANVSLSEEQTRRLVGVYSNAYEAQGVQDPLLGTREMSDDGENPTTTRSWFEKQFARQQELEERIQTEAASFLTAAQLELLRKKSELESERFRTLFDAMPKTSPTLKNEDVAPLPNVEC